MKVTAIKRIEKVLHQPDRKHKKHCTCNMCKVKKFVDSRTEKGKYIDVMA